MPPSPCSLLLHSPQTDCGCGICSTNTNTTLQYSCTCNEGWSSIGDQALLPGAACNINNITLSILWGIVLLSLPIPFILAVKELILRSKGMNKTFFTNFRRQLTLWMVPLGLCGYCTCMFVVCILKISQPQQRFIGQDPTTTTLFFVAVSNSTISAFGGAIYMLDIALQQMRMTSQTNVMLMKYRLHKSYTSMMVLSFCSEILSIGVLWAPAYVNVFVGIFGAVKFFILSIFSPVIVWMFIRAMLQNLNSAIKTLESSPSGGGDDSTHSENIARLQHARQRLSEMESLASKILPFQGLVILVVCTWPYLIVLMSYFYPIMVMVTAPSLFVLLRNVRGSSLKRPPNRAAPKVRDTFTIVDDGQAVPDSTISIVQHDFLEVGINSAIFGANGVLAFVRFQPSRRLIIALSVLYSSGLCTTLAVSLCLIPDLSILYFLLVVPTILIASGMLLSKPIMIRLLMTDFLLFRLATLMVGLGTLIDTLSGDLRVLIPIALCVLQLFTFCSDALLLPQLRALFVLAALSSTTTSFIVIFFNFALPLRNTILPIGTGYSILQSARDGLLGQIILLTLEILFVVRGRNQKRFLHVTNSVDRVLMDRTDTRAREQLRTNTRLAKNFGGTKLVDAAGASTVVVQSGFMLRQVSNFQQHQVGNDDGDDVIEASFSPPKKTRARVYVNIIAVKQVSAFVYVWFDQVTADKIVTWVESSWGALLFNMSMLFPLAVAIAMPFASEQVVIALSYSTIPCLVYVIVQQWCMLSRNILRLLVKRVSFIPHVTLILAWMAIASRILGDARAIVVVFAALTHIVVSVLSDAHTARIQPHLAGSRLVLLLLGASPMIFILSMYMLLDLFPHTVDVTFSLRNGQVEDSNSLDVFDLEQLCADFGMFSLAIPALVFFANQMRCVKQRKQYFKSFAAPIGPKYNHLQNHSTLVIDNSPISHLGPGSPGSQLVETNSPIASHQSVVEDMRRNDDDGNRGNAVRLKVVLDELNWEEEEQPEIIGGWVTS